MPAFESACASIYYIFKLTILYLMPKMLRFSLPIAYFSLSFTVIFVMAKILNLQANKFKATLLGSDGTVYFKFNKKWRLPIPLFLDKYSFIYVPHISFLKHSLLSSWNSFCNIYFIQRKINFNIYLSSKIINSVNINIQKQQCWIIWKTSWNHIDSYVWLIDNSKLLLFLFSLMSCERHRFAVINVSFYEIQRILLH